MDLRLHILARVPTIPIEHHIEVAALAQRVIDAVGEGTVALSDFEETTILWELPHYTSENTSLSRSVHCLRLLGHLPKDHPLVETAMKDLEGVTPLVNNGAAILYEAFPNWADKWVRGVIHEADITGGRMTEMSYRLPPMRGMSIDVSEHIDGFLKEHPGAVCLARKHDDMVFDYVAEPLGRMWEENTGEEVVFIGKSEGGHIGFSVLMTDGERWDVLDPNGSFVAGRILDRLTARSIAINHCLSGEKSYRRGR